MEVLFKKKAIPVPLYYQPIYKITIILAILKFGTKGRLSGKATISKLHLYAWGLRSDENYSTLLNISGRNYSTLSIWSFEPALERALIIAMVKGYCLKEQKSKNSPLYFVISDKGKKFLQFVIDNELFVDVIYKIRTIGNISEADIKKLIKVKN